MKSNEDLNDDDREEILRLVLMEAGGTEVAAPLAEFPAEARSTFRRVVCEARLVNGKLVEAEGEMKFGGKPLLTDRGRRRLKEIDERRKGGENALSDE